MAPLNGNTLGEKHKNYNSLVKEIITQGTMSLQKINYDADDIDNMINIDIACNEKNVDYIMDVLICEDILYVTRAIKKSSWLITEPEYAHLINPDYLDSKVFPKMKTKGIAKLMLQIRRHLRDEKRVEDFFNYVAKNNRKMATKWLEHCSFRFLEENVTSYAADISSDVLKRLCLKYSIRILEMYVSGDFSNYQPMVSLQNVLFLLKSRTEEFLNITDVLSDWTFLPLRFNKKATQFLMKYCFQRIIENFQCYHIRIDIPTFIKYLKEHNRIESFILSESVKTYYELKPFLEQVPQEIILDLLRKKYGIQQTNDNTRSGRTDVEDLFYAIESQRWIFSMVYRWYEFAPHELAFRDLQKFIYAESSPKERHSMLIVLLTNARKNMDHVRTVLQYYHDKHINEPYINKIQFVNSVLAQHDTFRFDEATWLILNTLFHSLEVYIQSKNKVQQCLVTIIIRSVLNDDPVHEIVEQRFYFKTLVHMKQKLNKNEQEKLFNYLHNYLAKKMRSQDTHTETGMKQAIAIIANIWKLLKDWKKEKTHYHFLIESIIQIGRLNRQSSWDIDMNFLNSVVKRYLSQISENLFLLYPSEEVVINALKYNPDLLEQNKAEVRALCRYDSVSLKTLYSKLRIYWRESLASEWRNEFIYDLENGNDNEATVRGVILLSSQSQLLNFIQKYSPSQTEERKTSMQKYIAKRMHLARPQLPVKIVLSYAQGDCVQHALCSVNSIYHSMSTREFHRHIGAVWDAHESLQKHSIRLASARVKEEKLLVIFSSIWKSSSEASIRNMLFQWVSKLLRKEDGTLLIETWKHLSDMIGDLNNKENEKVYRTLSELSTVPVSVVGDYYQKSYPILKNLPVKSHNLKYLFQSFLSEAEDFIQYLDNSFVEKTIIISAYNIFAQNNQTLLRILSAYLLCSKDEGTQMKKYTNIFDPLFSLLESEPNNKFDSAIVDSFQSILTLIARFLPKYVFEMNMVMPIKILTHIRRTLESKLFKNVSYGVTTQWKLFVGYLKVVDEILVKSPNDRSWKSVHNKSINKYSEVCLEYLKDDIVNFFPSIHLLFADALTHICRMFKFDNIELLKLLDSMLICKDVHVYKCVLKALPNLYSFEREAQLELDVIRRKLYRFPCKELKVYYFARYSNKYKIEECASHSSEDSKSDSKQENN